MYLTLSLLAGLFFWAGFDLAEEPVFGKPLSIVKGEEGLVVEARALSVNEGDKVFPAGFYRYILTHRERSKSDLNSFFSDYHIVHYFEGTRPELSEAKFKLGNKQVIQLTYHTGANLTVLEYGIVKNGLLAFFDSSIASNMAKFDISNNGKITSFNSIHLASKEKAVVCMRNYQFVGSDRLVEISSSSECDT